MRTLGESPTDDIRMFGSDAADTLARGFGRDLLVVPAGPQAAAVLSEETGSVLVARPVPDGRGLLDSVLIAVDGSPEAHTAAQLGSRLALSERTMIALVASPEHDARHQGALQADAATIEGATGRRPLILDEHGPPTASIVQAAASIEATLIVLGSRPGHPVDSVSAQVAGRAACSVLVLRNGGAP
jgi:nucleotide-binding universal stress UspA family protein